MMETNRETDGGDATLRAGQRVVVRTPDRREFRGILVELKEQSAVIRFDTGWMTTYPLHLVFAEDARSTGSAS